MEKFSESDYFIALVGFVGSVLGATLTLIGQWFFNWREDKGRFNLLNEFIEDFEDFSDKKMSDFFDVWKEIKQNKNYSYSALKYRLDPYSTFDSVSKPVLYRVLNRKFNRSSSLNYRNLTQTVDSFRQGTNLLSSNIGDFRSSAATAHMKMSEISYDIFKVINNQSELLIPPPEFQLTEEFLKRYAGGELTFNEARTEILDSNVWRVSNEKEMKEFILAKLNMMKSYVDFVESEKSNLMKSFSSLIVVVNKLENSNLFGQFENTRWIKTEVKQYESIKG